MREQKIIWRDSASRASLSLSNLYRVSLFADLRTRAKVALKLNPLGHNYYTVCAHRQNNNTLIGGSVVARASARALKPFARRASIPLLKPAQPWKFRPGCRPRAQNRLFRSHARTHLPGANFNFRASKSWSEWKYVSCVLSCVACRHHAKLSPKRVCVCMCVRALALSFKWQMVLLGRGESECVH